MSTMPEFVKGYVIVSPAGKVMDGTNSDTEAESIEMFKTAIDITTQGWLALEDQGYRCAPVSMRIEPAGCGQ